jgi:hypothetical protein
MDPKNDTTHQDFPTESFQQWLKENHEALVETLIEGDFTCPCCGADMDVSRKLAATAVGFAMSFYGDHNFTASDKVRVLINELFSHYRDAMFEKHSRWMKIQVRDADMGVAS